MDTTSSDTDLDWPQERELIKSFKANDIVGVFTVGKVKLVLPGGASEGKAGGKSGGKSGSKSGGKKQSQKKGGKK